MDIRNSMPRRFSQLISWNFSALLTRGPLEYGSPAGIGGGEATKLALNPSAVLWQEFDVRNPMAEIRWQKSDD